jgi:hypothetical protein
MWVPRRLTILWASTACYRDSFTFFYFYCYHWYYCNWNYSHPLVTVLHPLSLISVSILSSHWHFGLSSGLFAAGCRTKILWAYALLISPLSLSNLLSVKVLYQRKGFDYGLMRPGDWCVGTDVCEEPSFSIFWTEVADYSEMGVPIYETACILFAVCLLALLFDPEDGGSTFLRNLWQATWRHVPETVYSS